MHVRARWIGKDRNSRGFLHQVISGGFCNRHPPANRVPGRSAEAMANGIEGLVRNVDGQFRSAMLLFPTDVHCRVLHT
jgi:hypothetical protein